MVPVVKQRVLRICITLAVSLASTVGSGFAIAQVSKSEASTTSRPGSASEPSSLRSVFDSRHVLSFGGTREANDAVISAGADNFDGVSLTLDDLGISSRDTSFFAEYRYRVKPRWSLVAGAYEFDSSGGRRNSRDFSYDGIEFSTGSELEASLKIDAYIFDVMYSVYHSDKLEVMLGGGIHALDLSAELSAGVNIGEQGVEAETAATSLLAPVPNFRGSATWAASERVAFTLTTGWLSANVDEYSGDFLYAHLRAVYRITESIGASLGYQITDINVTEDRPRGDLAFDVRLSGPTFTLTYSF